MILKMKSIFLFIVRELATQYKFNYIEALDFMGVLSKKIIIPYNGEIMKTRCKAIKWSYGLHTQCRNHPEEDSRYCFKCRIRSGGILADVNDRLKCGIFDFVDKKNRRTVTWMDYIKKKKLDDKKCLKYFTDNGITIQKEQLILNVRQRGRPKKVVGGNIIINNIFDIIKNCMKEETEKVINLYKIDGNRGISEEGHMYELLDCGAVRIFE